jgi:arginine decarboxylase
MPGVNAQGIVDAWGIPAAILTEFLDGRRVEIARTGDYTVLVLFSVGTSKGKWGALLENLFEFKRLYDTDADLSEAMPELVSKYPARYRGVTLRELSDEMHSAMVEMNLSGLVNAACDEDFDPVLTPAQAYQKLVRGETEKIPFEQMAGRIAAVMLVPYPPGIPMSMPGERLGDKHSPVMKLIIAMEEFGRRFPGFERETHGIETGEDASYWMRAVIEAKPKRKSRKKPVFVADADKQPLKSRPVRRAGE